MDNPTTITVLGSIIAAIVLAIFGLLAGNIQKKQSDADKADLLRANKVLSDSVNSKNEELAKKSDDHTKKLDSYTNLIVKYAADQKAKDKEVIKLQEQLLESAEAQKQKTEEINKLNLKLIEAQEKTIGFTSESLNYITGGDSYCYIVLSQPFYGSKELDVYLHHVGKYPLSALRISITREEAARRESKEAVQIYRFLKTTSRYLIDIPIGPLPKLYKPILIGKVPVDPGLYESFNIFFYAQNGVWIQSYSYQFNEYHQSKTSYYVLINGKRVIDETNHKYF